MPCSDGYTNDPDMINRLNLATRVACELAKALIKAGEDEGYEPHEVLQALTKETRSWVRKHDRADAQRIRKEREEHERKKIAKHALKKLSHVERDALGLR